ncbi:MAG TPA: beta-ketoacyl-ACP synthase II [Tepidiformaceae bacterium]|nr:beta-ketoacyl-ACP synthase II [Tepidiformaceae bacterium]
MSRRVVVTGLGLVTPVGHNACDSWDALVAGRSGTARISLFDPTGYESQVAGEVKDWDAAKYMDRKEARRADRFTQFAAVAADEALRHAQYAIDPADGTNVAVIIGTAIGGITTLMSEYDTLLAKGPGRVSPFLMPMMLPDMASGSLSIRLGAKGVNYCLVSACASGADSIGEAANIIRRGDADVAIAGGTEAPITPIAIAGFAAAKALTSLNDEPERASRPFDATRDGFVLAEGAGVLVLEAEEHARARGARILAEVAGYGATSDAYHITQPDEQGAGSTRAMRRALAEAGLQPDDIGYINAHGTSTSLNDRLETFAIKKVFGDYAHTLPISSTKTMTGHLLGAAGAIEAAFSVLALTNGILPPTATLVTPDDACDLDYVPGTARSAAGLEAVMSNSLGFGGHNASLIFRRYEPSR